MENQNIYLACHLTFLVVVESKSINNIWIPVLKPGKSQPKLAIQTLMKPTDKYLQMQIIDKTTRKHNMLDLCVTNTLQKQSHVAAARTYHKKHEITI